MLSLTHTVVGGAIGAGVENSALAFSLGVAAHFIFDKIPHVWPKDEKSQKKVEVFDGVSTVLLLVVFFFIFPNQRSIFWGGLGGAVVDGFLVLTPLVKSKFGFWHMKRQPHFQDSRYYLADLILLALFTTILIWVVK